VKSTDRRFLTVSQQMASTEPSRRAGHHDDRLGPEAAAAGRRRVPGFSQTLLRRRRTALGRRTLWPAGVWSERTQPTDAGERSGEVTRTTREAGLA
jgi:hypothetical protein